MTLPESTMTALLRAPGRAALAAVVVSSFALPALAQEYVPVESVTPYAPIAAGEGTTLFTDSDDGFASVELPFVFRFYGRSYGPGQPTTNLFVSVNGGVAFAGRDALTGQLFPLPGANVELPSTRTPQGLVLPLWDDFVANPAVPNGGSRIAWKVEGTEGSRRLVIDWNRVQHYAARGPNAPSFSFSLGLVEGSDRLELSYGPRTGDLSQAPLTATVGVENASGTAGMTFFPCNATCTNTQVPADSGKTFAPNTNPALSLSVVVDGSSGHGPMVTTRIANAGNSGGTAPYALYLSTDPVLDAGDALLHTSAPITIGARPAAVTDRVAVDLGPSVLGTRYIIGVVDPDKTLPALDRTPNTGSSPPFMAGPDLQVEASATPSAAGGAQAIVMARITNGGTTDIIAARIRVMLGGARLRVPRELVRTAPRAFPAQQTIEMPIEVTLPTDVLPGLYNYTVHADPENAVVEGNETNNNSDPIDVELTGPDIGVVDVRLGNRTAYQGLTFPLRVAIQNLGPVPATNFTLGVFVSTNDTITLHDRKIFSSPSLSIDALVGSGGLAPMSLLYAVTVPTDLAPGLYKVGVILDPGRTLPESERVNNTRIADDELEVFAPASDLTVTGVGAQAEACAGETARVSALVTNIGAAPAEFGWSVVLSSNTTVSANDTVLATGRLSLAQNAQQVLALDAPLPSTLPAGQYTVGVVLDPAREVAEIDETNNVGASPTRTDVRAAGLVVTTPSLPNAIVGTPYEVRLAATGGSGRFTWRLAGGALPDGLTLDATGRISGTALTESVASVVVEVKSDGIIALATFPLSVRTQAGSLGLVDGRLPPARIARPYTATLGAVGGTAPYRFSLDSGALPAGLALADDGSLTGIPTTLGTSNVVVAVTDRGGHRATGTVRLDVLGESTLAISPARPRDGQVGKEYAHPFDVQGGTPPYAATITDGALPPGLSVQVESQGQAMSLAGTPETDGVWSFTLVVSDATGARDMGHFALRIAHRKLTFITGGLPAAQRGATYRQTIGTNARPPATITLVSGELPPGLILDTDGTIGGHVADDAPLRLYAFAVRVVDGTGGEATGAFAIDLPLPVGTVPPAEGCASVPGAGVLALAMLLLGRVRRRHLTARSGAMLSAIAMLVVALAPSDAAAVYRVARSARAYQQLSNGFIVFDASVGNTPKATSVPLPFPFSFWGTSQNAVTIATTGFLSFGGVLAPPDNTQLPSGGAPLNFVAPFWDFMVLSPSVPTGVSQVSWVLEGTAPNRTLAVEWRNVQHFGFTGSTYPAYSFQVRLHEGSNDISLDYGSVSALGVPVITATMGVQGPGAQDGFDISDRACSPGCAATAFPNNARFRLSLAPDLGVTSVAAPESVYIDADTLVRSELRNTGGADAVGVTVTFKLSRDILDDGCVGDPEQDALRVCDDTIIGTSSPASVLAGRTATVESHLVVPGSRGLTPGVYNLLAIVDARQQLVEVNEDDNAGPPRQVVLTAAAPDYVVTRLLGASAVDAGGTLEVTRTIRNAGNRTGRGRFVLVLSSNAQASTADLVLERRDLFTLAAGAVLDETVRLTVPANVTPGNYWLGLLVRPTDGETELDPVNGDRVFGPIAVRGAALTIANTELPQITVGAPFAFQLSANRPLGSTTWAAGFPQLPAGVSLSPTGVVSGVLDGSGEWPFEVRATSGGATVSRLFRLRALGGDAPLRLSSSRLPTAESVVPYLSALVATGGTPPYTWSLLAPSAPPAGLVLGLDGTLEGTPLVDGSMSMQAQVTDAEGATAAGEVVLPVAGPARPLFVTQSLPDAQRGEEYAVTLAAVGGTRPYRFTVVETRRVPDAGTPDTTSTPSALPAGLTLADGAISGTPTETGTFFVTLRLEDERGTRTTATWLLTVSDGSAVPLAITTGTLPDAIVGERYDAVLTASGGTGDEIWRADFVGGMTLPAGITIDETGRLRGTARAVGATSFLAVVTDGAGRTAVRALGLRVVAAPVESTDASGCSGVDVGALGFAVALLALRRRRALVAAACLATIVACTEKQSPCPEGCAAGLTCDATDNICKCGGHGGAVCAAGETCDDARRTCLAPTCGTGCPTGTICGGDGSCHCGTASGEICDAGETCGSDGRCRARDVCDGVLCTGELLCDPDQQGACRCGPSAAACVFGERCRQGACVSDLCFGVACSGGTQCDRTDGLCKCGGRDGAICSQGEACDAEIGRCKPSLACAGVSCKPGESCDPVDGTCRCGGPGGPKCATDQWCSPVARQCAGGDRCANVACAAGLSCDAEDGVCKCGGTGGAVCEGAESCVVSGARTSCVRICNPLTPSVCGDGAACRYDELAGTAYCQVSGTGHESEPCGPGHSCGPGLHCVGSYINGPGHCEPYCLTNDTCPAGFYCRYLNSDSPPGVCVLGATP